MHYANLAKLKEKVFISLNISYFCKRISSWCQQTDLLFVWETAHHTVAHLQYFIQMIFCFLGGNCSPVMVFSLRIHVLTRPILKALKWKSNWNWNVSLKWACHELECRQKKQAVMQQNIVATFLACIVYQVRPTLWLEKGYTSVSTESFPAADCHVEAAAMQLF